jgi:tRNA pseudouridine55 synthase
MQVPPLFSACNINGKRAYEIGRKGGEAELAAKQIRIDEIELIEFDDKKKTAVIRVVCGKGTYIRSLVRDIGQALGSGAFLTDLCRTKSGNVSIDDCMSFDEFREWFAKQDVEPYGTESAENSKQKKPRHRHT